MEAVWAGPQYREAGALWGDVRGKGTGASQAAIRPRQRRLSG
jgi:hypothetical protein